MATLRGEGLVDVAHGRGSFVRDQQPIQRIRRDTPGPHSLPRPRDGQVPVIAYMPASPHLAALLDVPNGAELLVREAHGDDPDAPYLTTSYLPAALADSPPLDDPNTAIADLDDALTVLGHRITHTERVTARIPTPDERDLFDLAEGVPVLQATRLTHDTDNHTDTDTPLEARITIYPAHGIELEYRLTPP